MICTDCGVTFNPRDSIMGDDGQCQDCWETECSKSFWQYVEATDQERKK